MGFLVDGAWQDVDMRTQGGHFIRKPTVFHNYVTADGGPRPSGTGGFPAERGRYHLYVSLACPWAHRTLIFRKLEKLEDVISVSVTEPDPRDLMRPFPAEPMRMWPISTRVNKPEDDDPSIVEPLRRQR